MMSENRLLLVMESFLKLVQVPVVDICPTFSRQIQIYYAAFDFCNMPFKDNSIDIISDGGGIGNCEGVKGKALKEAFRVLKPGGKLIAATGFVTREILAVLPEEAQRILPHKRPMCLKIYMRIRCLQVSVKLIVSLADVGIPMMTKVLLLIWLVPLV